MISFSVAVKNGFKKAFDFKGCATRAEYWWWQLFCLLIRLPFALLLSYLLVSNLKFDPLAIHIILLLIEALLFIPSLSVLIRRLHDVGQSWTLLLWCFIPILGIAACAAVVVATLWEGDSYNQPSTEQ